MAIGNACGHGFSDALKRYRELSVIRSSLKKRLIENPPDVFIGIDAPDFNLISKLP